MNRTRLRHAFFRSLVMLGLASPETTSAQEGRSAAPAAPIPPPASILLPDRGDLSMFSAAARPAATRPARTPSGATPRSGGLILSLENARMLGLDARVPALDPANIEAALGRLRSVDRNLQVIREAGETRPEAILGVLSPPVAPADVAAAARRFALEHGGAVGFGASDGSLDAGTVSRSDPVTMVRFRQIAGGEATERSCLTVTFDREGRIIALAGTPVVVDGGEPSGGGSGAGAGGPAKPLTLLDVSTTGERQAAELPSQDGDTPPPGDGAPRPRGRVLDVAAYPALRAIEVELTHLRLSGDDGDRPRLEGRHFRLRTGAGSAPTRANADGHFLFEPPRPVRDTAASREFLEVNAYYHLERARALLRRDFPSTRLDAPITVDLQAAGEGSLRRDNAFFDAATQTINFLPGSGASPALDLSALYHEYGHSVFQRLTGLTAADSSPEAPILGEGFADYIASDMTGSPIQGALFLAAPRDARTVVRHPDALGGDPHLGGRLISGIGWALRGSAGEKEARVLMLGAAQLAPQPLTIRRFAIGLVLADRIFHGGEHRVTIERLLAERAVTL